MIRRTTLFALLLFLSLETVALGLRDITVNSSLNEKLDARIGLASVDISRLSDIRVSLASQAAFDAAGVDRPFLLSKLQFKIIKGADGRPYIQVTTRKGVREPFVDFLVELAWPGGNLVRQYTILLDPPSYQPPLIRASAGRSPRPIPQPEQTASSKAVNRGSYGPVRNSETLWVIAKKTRPDSRISIEQMMMALQRRNPGAFNNGNVNLLRKGAVLEIPDRAFISELNTREARQAFRQQTREWKAMRENRRRGVAPAATTVTTRKVEPSPAPDGASGVAKPQASDGAVTDAPEKTAVSPFRSDEVAATQRQLRLVETEKEWSPNKALDTGKTVAAENESDQLRRAITESQKDLTAVRDINRDLDELRLVLETKIEALRKSLEERDQAIDDLQAQIDRSRPSQAASPERVANTKGTDRGQGGVIDLVTEVQAPASKTPSPPKAEKPVQAEENKPVARVDQTAEEKRSSTRSPEPAPDKQEAKSKPEAGPLEIIKRYWLYLAAVIGLLVLIAALSVVRRSRRRETDETAEGPDTLDSYVELDEPTDVDAVSQASSPTERMQHLSEQTEELSDEPSDMRESSEDEDNIFSKAGMDISSALAEADIYLAYHRYGDAESLVKDAIRFNPDSVILKAKLIEIYAFRKDKRRFTAAMESMHHATADKSPEMWARVVEMGQDLVPNHPLIQNAVLPNEAAVDEFEAGGGLTLDGLDLEITDDMTADEIERTNKPNAQSGSEPIEMLDLDLELNSRKKGRSNEE
ncbi:MAG: hypothetical protein GY703_09435 [Gammaproteobacteria bacterium]|nr:hypothetical protein [Gammaproteobacteria bacterium]